MGLRYGRDKKKMAGIYDLLEKSGAYVYKGQLKLPARTWPGAYTLIYLTEGNDVLCADCATTDYFEWLYSLNTCDGWQYDPPVVVSPFYEGSDEICESCNKVIVSSYGDPEATGLREKDKGQMAHANYKITITEHDYFYTNYVTWVQANSKNQAIVKAAALAGQEKNRREFARTGHVSALCPDGLQEPEVKVERVDANEYWDHRDEVQVTGI